MEEKFLFGCSVICFTLGVIYLIVSLSVGKEKRKSWKVSPFTGLAIGTAISLGFMYFNGYGGDHTETLLERLLMTVLGIIGVVTGGNDVEVTREQVSEFIKTPTYLFAIYTAALHIASSSVIIAFILKIVDGFWPMIRYMLFGKRNLYIFSALTERGVLLAEDIYENYKNVTLVFLTDEAEAHKDSLKKRVSEIDAYVFPNKVDKLDLPFFSRNTDVNYMLFKDNRDDNVKDALALANKYPEDYKRKKVHLYILNENAETLDLLDAVEKNAGVILRVINESRMMIYHLLDREPLFLHTESARDILIIGAGKMGTEALKACSWCRHTLEEEAKIYILDKEITTKGKLEKDAPEMMTQENISYLQLDVETSAFIDFLREKRGKIGYVICALGDDRLNLRTVLDIRGVSYEEIEFDTRNRKEPFVAALLNDEFVANTVMKLAFDVVRDVRFEEVHSYDLYPYGQLKEFYTWKNICASNLEGAGIAVDFQYALESDRDKFLERDYDNFNYNRISSIACGLHAKYKIYTLLENGYIKFMSSIDWKKRLDENLRGVADAFLKDEKNYAVVAELAELEHERWNAYMRSEGWRSLDNSRGDGLFQTWRSYKNRAAKISSYITDWDNLPDDIKQYDIVVARATCDILEDAELYTQKMENKMEKNKKI